MSGDWVTNRLPSEFFHTSPRMEQHDLRSCFWSQDLCLTRNGWIVNPGVFRSGREVQGARPSLGELVNSADAKRALQALDEAIVKSVSDSYRDTKWTYFEWENKVLRRRLSETEQARSRLEQDYSDLRRGLAAAGLLETRDIRDRFTKLAGEWREDTAHMSSAISFSQHPAYLRIIGMGPVVLPFILEDLGKTRSHWFIALSLITGENPVRPEDKGKVGRMAEAWLAWGRERNLV